jgi:copper chaperone CopZ
MREASAPSVVIVGRELRKVKGEKKESISLQEIKKVTYDKKQISVYNKENVLAMKVPLRWVEYGEFYYAMVEQTGHFREQPYIEK